MDRCGLDVTTAAALVGLSAGCIELDQPGTSDASCPALSPSAGIDAGAFAGCCKPGGTCGARVDLRNLASGLDFGCVGPTSLVDAGAPRSCGAADAGDAGDASDAADASDAGVPPMCSDAAPCSWKQAMPTTSPPVLAWPAAAYDPVADRIIMFGGAPSINGGTPTAEMWAWDGSNWATLTPARKPPARWTHGMVYDEDRRRIVLFGGLATDQASGALNDTWEWDGTNWTQVTTTSAPSARGIHGAITYDSSRKRVVLRGGGIVPGQPTLGDTWTYDGTNWTEVTGAGPSPRVAPAIVFDKARNEVVLFGGGNWSPYFGDTWRWNGTSWNELTPGTAPSARQSARMIYDATRSLVLLFGGDNGQLRNDLWQYNGQSWSEVIVAGPPPRCCFAFAHDTKRNQAVLFGGPDNQTWVYGN
jgi:hypothetical protein